MNRLLIDARRARNLGRKDLAQQLNISMSMVAKVEGGYRNPSAPLLKKWATLLQIPEEKIYLYFFGTISV